MQFQVPQFIDTEDKIVGPFSLKQFAYVGAAAILSALFYFFAQPWLWVIASIIFFGAGFALAFVKIQGRPFANVILSAFNFYWKPQTYIWQAEKPAAAVHPSQEKIKADAGRSALEEILAKSVAKTRSVIKSVPSRTAKVFSPQPHAIQPEQSHTAQPHPTSPQASIQQTRPQPPLQAQQQPPAEPKPISRETVSAGSALHKIWENIQTGAPFAGKESDKQFFDEKMMERYQIFRRPTGDRHAAKRVDYR